MKLEKKFELFKIIMNKGGEVILKKKYFDIKKIRAVDVSIVHISIEEENDIEKWNEYVAKIHSAIGVKNYCEWVRDGNHEVVGVMAFYTSNNEEIKTKYFSDYANLIQRIK